MKHMKVKQGWRREPSLLVINNQLQTIHSEAKLQLKNLSSLCSTDAQVNTQISLMSFTFKMKKVIYCDEEIPSEKKISLLTKNKWEKINYSPEVGK
jgi:hypothetical protein